MTKKPGTKLLDNETFQNFSNNIAIPTLLVASYISSVGEAGALMKAANNVFKKLSFREANLTAEQLTYKILQERYPTSKGYEVLSKPKLKYDEISGSFYPDFVVMNKNERAVIGVFDSKGASGSLTKQQKPFFTGGERATFAEGEYKGISLDPSQSKKQTINWNRATGDRTFTTY
ncbi:MAG: hypothetical protein M9933_19100 [Chitinophagaceae bacterium]|nr:hypothetical protein [Chitinophagaceae bacterium]